MVVSEKEDVFKYVVSMVTNKCNHDVMLEYIQISGGIGFPAQFPLVFQ